MTDYQHKLIQALQKATFPPGTFTKRFVRDLGYKKQGDALTPKQAAYLLKVGYMYRRQIPAELVPPKPKAGASLEDMDKLRAWNAGEPK
jgi:hypothetical protein